MARRSRANSNNECFKPSMQDVVNGFIGHWLMKENNNSRCPAQFRISNSNPKLASLVSDMNFYLEQRATDNDFAFIGKFTLDSSNWDNSRLIVELMNTLKLLVEDKKLSWLRLLGFIYMAAGVAVYSLRSNNIGRILHLNQWLVQRLTQQFWGLDFSVADWVECHGGWHRFAREIEVLVRAPPSSEGQEKARRPPRNKQSSCYVPFQSMPSSRPR